MDPIDSDRTMSRDQILADSERRRNGLSLPILAMPVSLFRALLPANPRPYSYLPYLDARHRAPFHRSLGNSLSGEFRGSSQSWLSETTGPRTSKDDSPLRPRTATLWRASSYLQRKVLQIRQIAKLREYSSRVPIGWNSDDSVYV